MGLARLGTDAQRIAVCTLAQLARLDLGAPLHSLIIPGECHPLESDVLEMFRADVPLSAPLQPGPPLEEVALGGPCSSSDSDSDVGEDGA